MAKWHRWYNKNYMNLRFVSSIIFLLLAFILPNQTLAYYESATAGDLRAIVYPQNPGPNENTSISLQSYLLNLDTCNYTWTLNNQVAQSGIGQKSFSFQSLPLGKTLALEVSLTCPDDSSLSKSFLFQSNNVDFLVSGNTYSPPFYRGGKRPTSGSPVRIVALPQVFGADSKQFEAKDLIYKWTNDGKPMIASSGYGKNAVTIDTQGAASKITLEISSLSGELKAVKSLVVRTSQPEVLIYEDKPLLGIQYQNSLSDETDLKTLETTLVAEPFFFDQKSLSDGKVTLNWYKDEQPITDGVKGQSLTLRQENGLSGKALIRIIAKDNSSPVSVAQKTLKINFGKKINNFGF